MSAVSVHVFTGAVMFTALVISGISDLKTKRIPKACSYGLLLFSLLLLICRGEYMLSVYFLLAVIAAGNKKLKPVLFVMAVIVFANKGELAFPLVFGLAATDILFSLKLIGGGDAQLLFSMLTFGWKSWRMACSIASVIIFAGTASVIHAWGIKNIGDRIKAVSEHMKSGTVQTDRNRLRIPFAALLPFAFLLFFFVSFPK